jgi:hypothetical protein
VGVGQTKERKCSIAACQRPAVVELIGKPPPTLRMDRTFSFCAEHGATYYEMGYETIDGGPFEPRLM